MQIDAILSDYDGTLCPAAFVRGNGGSNSKIPPKLEKILWNISKEIPVCIVSSKDFFFLHDKTKFAKVVSCMMGIETLVLNNHHYSQGLSGNKSIDDVERTSITGLQGNDDNFQWQSYKQNTEPLLKQAILQKIIMLQKQKQKQKQQQQKQYKSYPIDENDKENQQQLHIQTYSTHPFIDVYNIKSDKAVAFDITVSQLASFFDRNIMTKKVLYLGDSENDNPAFRKAEVSIGVRSDKRVNPKLDSKYTIQFSELTAFLERLQNNDFVFSNNILN
jgi:HAD superfamily hydrolase (TIGR01484 family)